MSRTTETEKEEEREEQGKICLKKSFKFIKEFPGEKRSGTLHYGKEEVESYLHETHSDPLIERQATG